MQCRVIQPSGDRERLNDLFETCRRHDGHVPISEHKYLDLVSGTSSTRWVFDDGARMGAYAHAVYQTGRPRWVMELVVHPAWRDRARLELLLAQVIAMIDGEGGGDIRIWTHHRAIAEVATSLGFQNERELLHMRLDLPAAPAGFIGPDVRITGFHSADRDAWVEVNNRAFAGHPENGSWTADRFEQRTQQPWFDPAGLLMAWHDGRLIGFCWTKMHPDGLGEIYVVAVDPGWQGRSIGKQLTLEGLRYLHENRRSRRAVLYVDANESKAVALYRSIGFEIDHVDWSLIRSV